MINSRNGLDDSLGTRIVARFMYGPPPVIHPLSTTRNGRIDVLFGVSVGESVVTP